MKTFARIVLSLIYGIVAFYFIYRAGWNAYHDHYDIAGYQIGMAVLFNLWADEVYTRAQA